MEARNGQDRLKKRGYSLEEAAVYLGLSVWSVRERIWTGEIPCIRPDPIVPGRPSRRIILDLRDLDAWFDKHKAEVNL